MTAFVSLTAPAAPRDGGEVLRGARRDSLHRLSQHLVLPRAAHSQRAAAARALRGLLQELHAELTMIGDRPSPEEALRLLRYRQEADRLSSALRRKRPRGASAKAPDDPAARLARLFHEIDEFAMDPIGQQARFEAARHQIEEALARPRLYRPLEFTVYGIEPSDEE